MAGRDQKGEHNLGYQDDATETGNLEVINHSPQASLTQSTDSSDTGGSTHFEGIPSTQLQETSGRYNEFLHLDNPSSLSSSTDSNDTDHSTASVRPSVPGGTQPSQFSGPVVMPGGNVYLRQVGHHGHPYTFTNPAFNDEVEDTPENIQDDHVSQNPQNTPHGPYDVPSVPPIDPFPVNVVNDPLTWRTKAKKTLLTYLPCILVMIVFAALIVCSFMLSSSDVLGSVPPLVSTIATIQMKVDDVFRQEMANRKSSEAKAYATRFCYHITQAVSRHGDVKKVDECNVNTLSNGSVRVDFELRFQTEQTMTPEECETVLIQSGKKVGANVQYGPLNVLNTTIQVFEVRGGRESETSAEFNCSLSGPHFRPFRYTYPSYCGEYQLCHDGVGIHLICEVGLEFTYDNETRDGPCRLKSNTTYCGRKRMEEKNASTSTSGSTIMSTQTTSSTASSPDLPMSTSSTSTSGSKPCSAIPSVILEDSPTLYKCNATAEQSFVPLNTTYPDNCDTFIWCKGEHPLNTTRCADGSHFVLGQNGPEACALANDKDTFCAQMELAKNCEGQKGG